MLRRPVADNVAPRYFEGSRLWSPFLGNIIPRTLLGMQQHSYARTGVMGFAQERCFQYRAWRWQSA